MSLHIKTQIFKELTGSFGKSGLFAKASAGNRVTQKMLAKFPGGNFSGNSMPSMHFAFDGRAPLANVLKVFPSPTQRPCSTDDLREVETLQGALHIYNPLRVSKTFYF